MTDWIARAQAHFAEKDAGRTVETAETEILAVSAVPSVPVTEMQGSSFGSFGSGFSGRSAQNKALFSMADQDYLPSQPLPKLVAFVANEVAQPPPRLFSCQSAAFVSLGEDSAG